jgi:hypothetical protein
MRKLRAEAKFIKKNLHLFETIDYIGTMEKGNKDYRKDLQVIKSKLEDEAK